MNRNTLFIGTIWILLLVALGLALPSFLSDIKGGDLSFIYFIVVTILLFIGLRWYTSGRIERLLKRSQTVDPFIAFYRRAMIGRVIIPNGAAFFAYAVALINILYANYPAARAALDSVDWTGRLPLVEGCRKAAEALLCYFDTRDYERGLSLAREAAKLGEASKALPGAATSGAVFASFVEIGEVLSNQATSETLTSLRAKLSKLTILAKIPIAWGLAIGYQKAGDLAQAEAMRAYLRKAAPYCKAVTDTP
jgi:hypothetical protein